MNKTTAIQVYVIAVNLKPNKKVLLLTNFHIFLEVANETTTFGGTADLTLESRLLAVVLMFTLLVAISLLISFYTEIAGKPTERNMVTGVLLGKFNDKFAMSSFF